MIATHLTAGNCRQCHEAIYQEFLRSRHAGPSWAAIYGEKGLTPEQVNFSETYQPGGTRRPPHPFVQTEGGSAMTSGCEQCHAVGTGLVGVIYHLQSRFFLDRTIKSLTYAAPFVAPLAYTGLGFLLLMNRMVRARSTEWARWVVFLALGGFFGNFVLSLTDHAGNGFFMRTEWIPVISSAFATGFLVVPLILPVTRRFLDLCIVVMLFQGAMGVLGFWFHLEANLVEPGASLWDRLVNGAPPLAPLLFPNLVALAWIGLWALAPHVPEPDTGRSWFGTAHAWAQPEDLGS